MRHLRFVRSLTVSKCVTANTVAAAISLTGVGKRYPGVVALDGVSLDVGRGEVHALVGENGAGKSTLIKIATGAIRPDAGTVSVGGVAVSRPTIRAMRDLGVRAVFQERNVAPDLTVAENVMLDDLPRRRGLVSRAAMRAEARRRLARLGIELDPDAVGRTLTVAQLQLIEIARASTSAARFLVLDEPTASLHRDETLRLFDVVRSLQRDGVGVLFISHHLDEVFAVAQQVTVLRDGRQVASGAIGEFDSRSLVHHMFGRDVDRHERTGTTGAGDVVLRLRDVCTQRLRGITADVRRGEVVAVAGAMGSGTSDFAGAVAGTIRASAGVVMLDDCRPHRTRHTLASRIGFVPADRKRRALLLGRSVADNVAVGPLAARPPMLVRPARTRAWAAEQAGRAAVRAASMDVAVDTLSGGNQQKVVIARWLDVGADVLVLDEPTVGIDVAAKFEIYAMLRQLARQGTAVVVCTTDFQEVAQVADRVLLLRSGRLVAELDGAVADEHRLVALEMSA